MKAYVSVNCDKCGMMVSQLENVYCEHCLDKKDEELHTQDVRIKFLRDELTKRQKVIDELMKIINLKKEKN